MLPFQMKTKGWVHSPFLMKRHLTKLMDKVDDPWTMPPPL